MSISVPGLDSVSPIAIQVQKLTQDQQKREGQQAVALIQQSAPPADLHGEGTHVNTYA